MAMAAPTVQDLIKKKCKPCEGGTAPMSPAEAKAYLAALPGWEHSADGKLIGRTYVMRWFMDAIELIQKIAEVAEAEDHHPDIHLTGYRLLRIELMTHAIGGLSENDFILAAKIESLPKQLKQT
jgi:4a-hydroxytetrahydrobiopterin dehydratase